MQFKLSREQHYIRQMVRAFEKENDMATAIKTIEGGFVMDDKGIRSEKVTCRFTKDKDAETLSLEIEGVRIGASFKDIEPVINKARKEHERKRR